MKLLDSPKQGCLLVSEPLLGDPNFEKSVIYLVAYSNEGAVGFIINHESDLLISDFFDNLDIVDMFILNGGPVETQNLYFIHKRPDLVESNYHISDQFYWGGDTDKLFEKIRNREISDREVVFFRGYSGWAPGQLENEIRHKSWIVVEDSVDELLNMPPEERWPHMLRKIGGEYLLWINTPSDPVLN